MSSREEMESSQAVSGWPEFFRLFSPHKLINKAKCKVSKEKGNEKKEKVRENGWWDDERRFVQIVSSWSQSNQWLLSSASYSSRHDYEWLNEWGVGWKRRMIKGRTGFLIGLEVNPGWWRWWFSPFRNKSSLSSFFSFLYFTQTHSMLITFLFLFNQPTSDERCNRFVSKEETQTLG